MFATTLFASVLLALILLNMGAYAQNNHSSRDTCEGVGMMETAYGSRSDVASVANYSYDTNSNPTTVTDTPVQTRKVSEYNESARSLTVIDANGVTIRLTYHPRGWLEASTLVHPSGDVKKDLVTRFDYDESDHLIHVTFPDGQISHYDYDGSRRLADIQNQMNERTDSASGVFNHVKKDGINNALDRQVYVLPSTLSDPNRVMDIIGDAD